MQDKARQHLVLATIDEEARPLSIRVLGAYAESIGVRTTLLVILRRLATFGNPTAFSGSEVRRLVRFLALEKVTHLGFYLMTASLKPYRLLAKALRNGGYRGVLMAGGVHPTLRPEESLPEEADFAVQGAGEVPLRMIMEGAEPATIPGLVWRRDGAMVINPTAPAQNLDLNALPFPLFRFDRDYILVGGKLRRLDWAMHRRHAGWHGRYYDLVTSRGCAYRCAYCCNVYGAPVRRQNVERVLAEIRHLKQTEPRVAGINVQDDSFYAGSDEWLREFCAKWKTEIGLPFIARMIPRYVEPARLALLKDAGLQYVTMGLEGSDRVNREVYNRKETAASFLKAARTVLAAGLWLSIDYIVHNPYETEEDLRAIARTLNALPRPHWWVVHLALTPFPGTALHARCVKDRTLERFSTDAYDSMLNPARPGGYLTPAFWLDLITVVLPNVNPTLGERFIAAGPHDPRNAATVHNLAKWFRLAKRSTTWLRDRTPWLYAVAYRLLRLGARQRGLPGGMNVVE
ncbi:MAG TPA: radical SAM protein [Kiritimatiellia bacterium]|nr:radical SAM protein [Kiritimatiellia bacterium]